MTAAFTVRKTAAEKMAAPKNAKRRPPRLAAGADRATMINPRRRYLTGFAPNSRPLFRGRRIRSRPAAPRRPPPPHEQPRTSPLVAPAARRARIFLFTFKGSGRYCHWSTASACRSGAGRRRGWSGVTSAAAAAKILASKELQNARDRPGRPAEKEDHPRDRAGFGVAVGRASLPSGLRYSRTRCAARSGDGQKAHIASRRPTRSSRSKLVFVTAVSAGQAGELRSDDAGSIPQHEERYVQLSAIS